MPNRIPIRAGQLKLGAPLTHDVYDQAGKLLLRRGIAVASAVQLEHIEAQGYYDPEAADYEKPVAEARTASVVVQYAPEVKSGPPLSVLAELGTASAQLVQVFAEGSGDVRDRVLAIVATIRRCCAADTDASLAYLMNPQPFLPTVRHPVNVATLVTIMLTRQKVDAARIQAAAAAALTMNMGAQELHHDMFFHTEAVTPDQRALIQAHPAAGVASLRRRGVTDALWLDLVAQHHEAHDGSGYPAGLSGDRIHPEAQMICLADRYCAMVSDRAQRDPMLPTQALKDINARHGKSIAPAYIAGLIASMGLYPPGTCVRLVNGETAVVVRRLLDPRHPVVFAICTSSGAAYDPPRKRLTASQPSYAIEQAILRRALQVPFKPEQMWPPTATDGTS
jgi:response regulator RpfG family c-di-GMP phosphodiesterase